MKGASRVILRREGIAENLGQLSMMVIFISKTSGNYENHYGTLLFTCKKPQATPYS